MKAGYGKTVRPVCAADGGKLFIGRLLRPDSDEAGVMLVERRGRVIDIGSGQLRSGDRPQEEPDEQWKAAAFARWHEPDESRGSRPESVRGSG